ncbi:methionine--tRNA ligase [Patescibacteria group bacterium]|nr:methionine--tRNA ligase [Patescibacteria group bacterium]
MNKAKNFFVTTPIYYVNDIPHIGHAYATFAADILARYHRQKGDKTFFLTGTDENSQKTVIAAEKAKKDIKQYTDELAEKWNDTWKILGISNDDFIRTTESRHNKIVVEIFEKVNSRGDLYKGQYEGLYCIGHEAFLKNADLDDKGLCPDHKTKPDHIVEENYFFKLSNYEKPLQDFYDKNPDFIQPRERYNEVKSFVALRLRDISITRATQKWGIPAPNDPKQVIYVWFDALINYISADPKKWPADIHIIGKDILRFHAVIWPAMLLSAGYELPKKIFAHGFFTVDGEKISKSLGNAIDPIALAEKYGVDALRYYLFKEIPFGNDGDFSHGRLEEVYNADLANGLGNLVARTAKLAEKLNLELNIDSNLNLKEKVSFALLFEDLNFQKALEEIWHKYHNLDHYLEREKPWEIKDKNVLKRILSYTVSEIIKINQFLEPFLPKTAELINRQLLRKKITSTAPLFPRI